MPKHKEGQDLAGCDLIINAQVMKSSTTEDGTMRMTIDAEASDDMACAFLALLGRDKAAVKLGIKVQ